MLFEFELAVFTVIEKFDCFQNPYAGDPLTKIDWHDYKRIAEDEQRTGTCTQLQDLDRKLYVHA